MQHLQTLARVARLLTLLLIATAAPAASLEVRLNHLRPTETVRVSLYNDAGRWSRQREPLVTRVVAAKGVTQTLRFEDLPPGRYAVRAEQAPNPGGGPAEPASFAQSRHGSSGNKAPQGIPSFDDAAVSLGTTDTRLSIHLFASSRD